MKKCVEQKLIKFIMKHWDPENAKIIIENHYHYCLTIKITNLNRHCGASYDSRLFIFDTAVFIVKMQPIATLSKNAKK